MQAAWRQMWRYRLRSALVISCAALGVAGAITAVNYAAGGRQGILEQIERLGTNLIVVSAKQSRAVAGRERTGTVVTTLVEPDYLALRRELLGPAPSSAVVSAPLRLKAGFLVEGFTRHRRRAGLFSDEILGARKRQVFR